MRIHGQILICVVALSALLPALGSGAAVQISQEYGELIQGGDVRVLKDDLFGDQIGLYMGSLAFMQTDLSIPGSNGLTVAVSRYFSPRPGGRTSMHFGDWELDVPRLHGVFSSSRGWVVPVDSGQPASTAYLRCSRFSAPPAVNGSRSMTFTHEEYWRGHFISLEGGRKQEILRNSNVPVPSGAGTYPLVTGDYGMFSCLPMLANAGSSTEAQGEGFLYVDTQGARYQFDHLTSRVERGLMKFAGGTGALSTLNRREVMIFPKNITDR